MKEKKKIQNRKDQLTENFAVGTGGRVHSTVLRSSGDIERAIPEKKIPEHLKSSDQKKIEESKARMDEFKEKKEGKKGGKPKIKEENENDSVE